MELDIAGADDGDRQGCGNKTSHTGRYESCVIFWTCAL